MTERTWPVPAPVAAHAERFYAEGREPVVPRVAATVVLLRPSPGQGFQVYAIRRAATMAFASGMYAFPGGSVDPADSDAVPTRGVAGASRLTDSDALGWAGPPPEEWARRLRLSRGAAQAVVCAAVREVFEEAGVLLAGPHPEAAVGDLGELGDLGGEEWDGIRRSLVARERSLTAVLAARGLAVRSDLLAPWTRWITPDFEPRRFDTYFFLALLPAGQRTRDVSGEADHTEWISPADAVARHASGAMAMLPPTLEVLRDLAAYGDVESALRAATDRDVATPVAPRIAYAPDGAARFVLG